MAAGERAVAQVVARRCDAHRGLYAGEQPLAVWVGGDARMLATVRQPCPVGARELLAKDDCGYGAYARRAATGDRTRIV